MRRSHHQPFAMMRNRYQKRPSVELTRDPQQYHPRGKKKHLSCHNGYTISDILLEEPKAWCYIDIIYNRKEVNITYQFPLSCL